MRGPLVSSRTTVAQHSGSGHQFAPIAHNIHAASLDRNSGVSATGTRAERAELTPRPVKFLHSRALQPPARLAVILLNTNTPQIAQPQLVLGLRVALSGGGHEPTNGY